MVEITFAFRDEYSHGQWREQSCTCSSVAECIKWYGLHECEYKILKVVPAK